jgi:hypothetical protein
MGIIFQMGIVIFCSIYLGIWLDGKIYSWNNPLFLPGLSLFSVFVGLYNVIRQVNNINKIINEQINYVLNIVYPLPYYCILHSNMQQRL